MPNVLFTADTHFNHERIIELCNRPFQDAEEMNEMIVTNWNSKVDKRDLVYHLGDFGFFNKAYQVAQMARRLNGNIQLIHGNHDNRAVKHPGAWGWTGPYKEIKIGDQKIVLFHYAQRVWNGSHHGSWMLYGHSHGSLRRDWQVKSFDVGVDMWNFTPISFEEVETQMKLHKKTPQDHHGKPPIGSIGSLAPPPEASVPPESDPQHP